MLMASPSHQTTQIRPNDDHGWIPPTHNVVTPIVALIAVLTSAPAPSRIETCRIRASEGLKPNRFSSHAPATASRVLPAAIPAATARGATVAFASSAPAQ